MAVRSAISVADNPLVLTETDGTLVLTFDDKVADPFVGVVDRGVDTGADEVGAVLVGVELTVDMPWGVPRLLGAAEAEADVDAGADDCSTTDPPGVSGTDDGSAEVCEVQAASSVRATSAPAQRRA